MTSYEMEILSCSICSPTFNDALTSRTFLFLILLYSIRQKNQHKYEISKFFVLIISLICINCSVVFLRMSKLYLFDKINKIIASPAKLAIILYPKLHGTNRLSITLYIYIIRRLNNNCKHFVCLNCISYSCVSIIARNLFPRKINACAYYS